MDHFHLTLLLLVAGFLLLGIGFERRDQEWGVRLIGAGTLLILVPAVLKIYLTLQLS
ncbi:hypothetical protein D9M68_404190 [compost metagenome]